MDFSPATRRSNIARMEHDNLDILVIGGGITGAGIAHDAALRGYTIGLLERDDFASGTSSKSARMVHGGLRYLEHFQFGLVWSACAERYKLYKMAPRLVRPTPFTYPVYQGARNNLPKIRLGMWLYDVMAMFRNFRLHRILDANGAAKVEPVLARQGLRGAAYYYDCLEDDSRLTLATIIAGHRAGAVIANHAEVRALTKADGVVTGAQVLDHISGESFVVRSRIVVNATGVWVDEIRQFDDSTASPIMHANRGTHLVFLNDRLPVRGAVAFRSTDGRRAMYALRWKNTTIVGTTDEDHIDDLDKVYATGEETSMMMDSINHAFPSARLTYADIVSTYAGLRPLIRQENKSAYQVSRDHQIYDSPSGLVSIAGGKLTTHRKMAEDMLNHIERRLKQAERANSRPDRRTDQVPLVDETFDPESTCVSLRQAHPNLAVDVLNHLADVYGRDVTSIVGSIEADPMLGQRISPELSYVYAEIPYAVRHEMALTLNDFLIRRTHIIYEAADQGLSCAGQVAAMMGRELDWDTNEIQVQVDLYQQEVKPTRRYRQELGLDT